MQFASDNAGPAHPSVLEALIDANAGYAPAYGVDPVTEGARAALRETLEAPSASVQFVTTGTAANSIALAALCPPWGTVFCTPVAHIHQDECNAPEFFSGGAKLTLVGQSDKLTPETLDEAIRAEESRGVHGPQRGPVSITQATERGRIYTPDEVAALAQVAHDHGLALHMDGARFANAVVALGCTPADLSWKAGVDALSFGGTKNGLLGVEAVVFFEQGRDWEVQLRRKRGAHLMSKHRYLGAQMAAYLDGGLWLELARAANAGATRLAEGLAPAGAGMDHPPQANIVFARLPRAVHARLKDAGAVYYLWDADDGGPEDEMLLARFVCDWSLGADQIDAFLALL
ncbi:threonine aldolase family protein [Poseidonocella sedimentorum]|uniref:L-threonine aldolase n=1 Tax=Poseidonocella sedimentorum TaxID=871652 RepID=A0A1I6DYF9_9RHOB|nr:beta-eliminating lyase-related protein [Poseidonocella sedimentorum]SFR10318.1 L-threonine aldolase [Poseidonocella sedimentorum]